MTDEAFVDAVRTFIVNHEAALPYIARTFTGDTIVAERVSTTSMLRTLLREHSYACPDMDPAVRAAIMSR